MLKTAMEFLVGMGEKKEMVVKGKTFIVGGNEVQQVNEATQKEVEASTLSSVVDYLEADPDRILARGYKVIVQVVNQKQVRVFTDVNEDYNRHNLLNVEANIPRQMDYGTFYNMEDFNIMLQSRFVENDDRGLLLSLVGNVKEENVATLGDDGVTQMATVKTGVASVNNVQVPNPVTLAPYRTFREVAQPESQFVFRMQSGPRAALFEADGGAWKLEAVNNVRLHLTMRLKQELGKRFEQVTILS